MEYGWTKCHGSGRHLRSKVCILVAFHLHAGKHQLSLSLGFQRGETQWQGLGESRDVRELWLLGVPQYMFNTHRAKAAPSFCKPLSLSVSLCHNSCPVMTRSPSHKASTQKGLCCVWLQAQASSCTPVLLSIIFSPASRMGIKPQHRKTSRDGLNQRFTSLGPACPQGEC